MSNVKNGLCRRLLNVAYALLRVQKIFKVVYVFFYILRWIGISSFSQIRTRNAMMYFFFLVSDVGFYLRHFCPLSEELIYLAKRGKIFNRYEFFLFVCKIMNCVWKKLEIQRLLCHGALILKFPHVFLITGKVARDELTKLEQISLEPSKLEGFKKKKKKSQRKAVHSSRSVPAFWWFEKHLKTLF